MLGQETKLIIYRSNLCVCALLYRVCGILPSLFLCARIPPHTGKDFDLVIKFAVVVSVVGPVSVYYNLQTEIDPGYNL